MKGMLLICVSLFILGGFAASSVQSAGMGLACAWLFNEGTGEKINDSVGSNHGQIEGDLKWVDGKFGKGLEFAGAGDSYVSIPHDDIHDADPYTITAWTKLKNTCDTPSDWRGEAET